jgi:hypothetical protein
MALIVGLFGLNLIDELLLGKGVSHEVSAQIVGTGQPRK